MLYLKKNTVHSKFHVASAFAKVSAIPLPLASRQAFLTPLLCATRLLCRVLRRRFGPGSPFCWHARHAGRSRTPQCRLLRRSLGRLLHRSLGRLLQRNLGRFPGSGASFRRFCDHSRLCDEPSNRRGQCAVVLAGDTRRLDYLGLPLFYSVNFGQIGLGYGRLKNSSVSQMA